MRYPDYDRSILSVSASILAHYGAETESVRLPELDAALAEKPEKVLLVILDGLGSEVLRRALPETAWLRRNTAATVTSVFPPTTAAATATLYSGLPPVQHGWLGWHLYFREYASDVKAFTSEDYYTGRRLPGPPPAPTLLSYESVFSKIRKADPSVALHMLSSFPTFFDRTADCAHRINGFEQGCATLNRLCAAPGRLFALLYWPQPDEVMHAHGTDSPQARAQYAELSASLERLSARLKDALLIVVSDHGLTDAPESFDLAEHPEVMDMLVMPPSLDRRASAFFVKPHRLADFETWFRETLSEDFIWIPREEAFRTGLFGPGAPHPKADDFIGSGIAAATGRRVIDCNLPGLPPHRSLAASHAGLTDEEMLVDVILARCGG